jgi:serine/threonine-protein kinase RsbW
VAKTTVFWYTRAMAKNSNHIIMEINSKLKYIETGIFVFHYLKNILKMSEDDLFKIEISLREMIANAIVHGNKSDPLKKVYLHFTWTSSKLRVIIRDENPESVDFEKIFSNIENNDLLSFRGRGIMIMKTYMDKFEFNSNSRGTEIVMEKNL